MNSIIVLCTLSFLVPFAECSIRFPNFYKKVKTIPVNKFDDNGEPLILTKYIENGRIEEGKLAAEVHHEAFLNITHYTGFFTVNKTHNTNIFMWFCPSESDPLNDPVVLWLQGGPGSTSLYGLFSENGPFKMKNESEVVLRNETWTKFHNMIYIDNPAGTGYSFTDSDGYAHDEVQIGEELTEAIQQFFMLFPELRKNDFFITGESYGGHYIPAVSYTIHKKNPTLPDNLKINLKGLAIGNGWTDPINQLNYGEYLYQHGIIDLNTKKLTDEITDGAAALTRAEKFNEAREKYNELLLLLNITTGFSNIYNYLYAFSETDDSMDVFVQRSDVRLAIHVGNSVFQNGDEVYRALNNDIMKSVAYLLPELLDNYKVLLFNGQLDIVVAYPLTLNYLQKLNFSAAAEYKIAPRGIWYVENDIAGFVKVAGNLTEILVRDAGHMVAHDQPLWASDLIHRFTRNKKFDV